MARGSQTSKRRPETSAPPQERASGRLCLTGTAAAIADALGTAQPGDVAAAILAAPAGRSGTGDAARARAAADGHDVAFLVADDPALAAELGADGAEIDWSPEAYAKARALIGADRSVGARVGLSRHRAMEAAEAGADYVRFAAEGAGGGEHAAMIDTALWWAEIFEVPCMASGPFDAEDVSRLADGGVEFIAVDAADFLRLGPALTGRLGAAEVAP